MNPPSPDISTAAGLLCTQLYEAGITNPDPSQLVQQRQQLISEAEPTIGPMLSAFRGDVEMIEIKGVACRQVTPANWSDADDICIQYAYGGGYVRGSTYEDLIITLPLAEHCNARIVMVEYCLSPEHPYPEPQRDMWKIYPELLACYGAGRLVVSGESAGGNQALALLLHIRDQHLAPPRCAALLSPWCDLANQGDSHRFNDGFDPTLDQEWVQMAAHLHANELALDDPGISPLYGDMRGLPPCIITTASRDLLLSQCLRLARKLHDADVTCDLRVWEGLWHVFEFYPIPEAKQSIIEIAQFIKSHC